MLTTSIKHHSKEIENNLDILINVFKNVHNNWFNIKRKNKFRKIFLTLTMVLKIANFFISFFIFIFFIILRPFRKIFVTRVFNTRIGHFLIEPEIHLLNRKYLRNRFKKEVSLYYLTPFQKSCNSQLEKNVEKKIINYS